jgi:hypothetical protein
LFTQLHNVLRISHVHHGFEELRQPVGVHLLRGQNVRTRSASTIQAASASIVDRGASSMR